MGRGHLDNRTKAHPKGEGRDRLKEEAHQLHPELVPRLVIIEEEVIDVLLREN